MDPAFVEAWSNVALRKAVNTDNAHLGVGCWDLPVCSSETGKEMKCNEGIRGGGKGGGGGGKHQVVTYFMSSRLNTS